MRQLLIGLLAASLLLLLAGCSDNDNDHPGTPTDEVNISVSVHPDTIWFVYGEPELAEITVLVTGGDGQPLAERPVMVHVSNSNIGEVDFEFMGGDHSTAWDTTDSAGQAVIPYLAVLSGDNLITVVAEGDTAYTTAVGRYPYHGQDLTISLQADPGDWNFSERGDPASIHVTATLRDELSLPVPGLTMLFHTQFGDTVWNLVTDENGQVETLLAIPESQAFPDDIVPECSCEIIAEISIFGDSQLILFRR